MGHIELALKLKEETGQPMMACLRAAQQYPYDYEKAKVYVENTRFHGLLVEKRPQTV